MKRCAKTILQVWEMFVNAVEPKRLMSKKLMLTATLVFWFAGWVALIYCLFVFTEYGPTRSLVFKIEAVTIGLVFSLLVGWGFLLGNWLIWRKRCDDDEVQWIGVTVFITSWPMILFRLIPLLLKRGGKKIIAAGLRFAKRKRRLSFC